MAALRIAAGRLREPVRQGHGPVSGRDRQITQQRRDFHTLHAPHAQRLLAGDQHLAFADQAVLDYRAQSCAIDARNRRMRGMRIRPGRALAPEGLILPARLRRVKIATDPRETQEGLAQP